MNNFNNDKINDINNLIDSKIPENLYIDYKSEISISKDADKKEFLADISAFANTYGGTIFVGIKEQKGVPVEIIGIKTDNIDNLIQTIEQLIVNCIQPRIIGYKIDIIKLKDLNYLIVIKIPQSWNAPHMVHYAKDTKFYIRDNNGKHQMSIDELRASFKFSDSINEKIKNFHNDRIEKIINNKLQFNFPKKPFFVAHWIPLRAFQSMNHIIIEIKNITPQLFARSYNYTRFNIDGHTAYDLDKDIKTYFYTQIFRNGIVESVDFEILHKNASNEVFPLNYYTKEISKSFMEFLKYFKENQMQLPMIFLLSIINAKGIPIEHHHARNNVNFLDRDEINLSEVLIDNYEIENYDLQIKPVLDSLWNACGFSHCYNYSEDNKLIK